MRIATLNVGTVNRRELEIVDMMMRRKIDIICLQETRKVGEESATINGYEMIYNGKNKNRGGVAIMMAPWLIDYVRSVVRIGDRLIEVNIQQEEKEMCVICVCMRRKVDYRWKKRKDFTNSWRMQ